MVEVQIVQRGDGRHRPVLMLPEGACGTFMPPRQRRVEIVSSHDKASDAVHEAATWLAEHGL